jgi:hypothetical protein
MAAKKTIPKRKITDKPKREPKPTPNRKNQTSFQPGNNFWEIRSKHGRDRLFETPELLWEAAIEYFQWCIDNPFQEQVVFHAQGVITKDFINKIRPFTMQGLCSYLDCNTVYFNHFAKDLEEASTEISDEAKKINADFSKIVTHIRETVYNQKFSGAASGFLNPNIIARDLGLTDKSDITSGDKPIQQVSQIEIIKISK